MKINTKQIMETFINILSHIADKEYQRRAWIHGEPSGTDFDETVNLFVDIGDPILKNYEDFGITDSQCQILRRFRNRFETFWENNGLPPLFIDTLEWNEITEMAKDVLKTFNFSKK